MRAEGNHRTKYIYLILGTLSHSNSSDMREFQNTATEILRNGLKSADAELTPFQFEVIENICLRQKDVLYID